MDLGIKDKIAFVAASSQGLGLSVAMELARERAIVIICSRSKKNLLRAKIGIEALSDHRVLALQGDISVAADRERIISSVLNEYGHVDILVTNSGGPPSGLLEEFDLADWQQAYELLLASAVDLVKGFLPGMKENKWGRIISITSQAVKQPVEKLGLSNSVRASVVGLIKTLSNELGEFNITANNVMPGYTETGRLEKLIEQNPNFAQAKNEIPLRRFGKPEEFAAAVTFLASERASYITGVSLAVDGGWIKGIM